MERSALKKYVTVDNTLGTHAKNRRIADKHILIMYKTKKKKKMDFLGE